jgi:hypothetical protein
MQHLESSNLTLSASGSAVRETIGQSFGISTGTSTFENNPVDRKSIEIGTKSMGKETVSCNTEKKYHSIGTSSLSDEQNLFASANSFHSSKVVSPLPSLSSCDGSVCVVSSESTCTLSTPPARRSKLPDPKQLKGLSNLLEAETFLASDIIDLRKPIEKTIKNTTKIKSRATLFSSTANARERSKNIVHDTLLISREYKEPKISKPDKEFKPLIEELD